MESREKCADASARESEAGKGALNMVFCVPGSGSTHFIELNRETCAAVLNVRSLGSPANIKISTPARECYFGFLVHKSFLKFCRAYFSSRNSVNSHK